MSYTSEASQRATQITNATNDSKNQHQRVVSSVRGASSWWKGEAYDAFNKKYGGIDRYVRSMHDSMGKTVSALKNLRKAIDKADTERAREAAKKK